MISDRRVQSAFARSVQRGKPLARDCAAGLHEPVFLIHTWACGMCGKALSLEVKR